MNTLEKQGASLEETTIRIACALVGTVKMDDGISGALTTPREMHQSAVTWAKRAKGLAKILLAELEQSDEPTPIKATGPTPKARAIGKKKVEQADEE